MAFDTTGLVVYVDGRFEEAGGRQISVFDHGLLYGDGVFEGLRIIDGRLFRPADHMARLARSLHALKLSPPCDLADLPGVVGEVARRSDLTDAHVRIVVTRGFGAPGLDPRRCERASLIVMAYPFPPLLGDQPLRLLTSAIVRKAPRSIGAQIKSLNYLDAILAKQQAQAANMDDAVMLDVSGAVAECTSTNLFLVEGGVLRTPTTRAALPGITRLTILECAEQMGIPVRIEDVWPMELYAADGIFVTGTGAGVVPVAEIDGRTVPNAGDPIVASLIRAYRARTHDPDLAMAVGVGGQ